MPHTDTPTPPRPAIVHKRCPIRHRRSLPPRPLSPGYRAAEGDGSPPLSVGSATVGDVAAEIKYVVGDATAPNGVGPRIIAHVCNDAGGWGKGFVVAVSRRWQEPEAAYRSWYREKAVNDFALGAVQLVPVGEDLFVANMIGQHGYRPSPGDPPIRYAAIGTALAAVGEQALDLGA